MVVVVSSDITVEMASDVPVQTVPDSDLIMMDSDRMATTDSATVTNSGFVVVVGSARVGSNMMPIIRYCTQNQTCAHPNT